MTLRETLDDTSTPLLVVAVIGVGAVLLIAAVLGTAVLGSFVLGTGDQTVSTATPSVTFSSEATDSGFVIQHVGGESVEASALLVTVDGDTQTWAALTGADSVAEGDTAEVSAEDGASVEVAFDGADGPVTLAKFRV
ncbi:type IV pilin [Halobaculum marinum]|uniref:Type IV pilin n=1 Tax=Halobaculum marinum TaxID=3031996 RepID=A0ABD5X3G0_9EURY|nr:type IV pilin [Halobaculum sp. DT55]